MVKPLPEGVFVKFVEQEVLSKEDFNKKSEYGTTTFFIRTNDYVKTLENISNKMMANLNGYLSSQGLNPKDYNRNQVYSYSINENNNIITLNIEEK